MMTVEIRRKKNTGTIFEYRCKDYETIKAVLYEYLQNHGYVVDECNYDVYKLDGGEFFAYIYEDAETEDTKTKEENNI